MPLGPSLIEIFKLRGWRNELKASSKDGFAYVTGGNPNPGDDLRPYNISSPENFKFILQELGSRRLNASKGLLTYCFMEPKASREQRHAFFMSVTQG